jgi:hypothetical protein
MYWNRFDIVEAWFLALEHCHSGMFSEEYRRMCRVMEYFNPSPFLSVERLSENGLVIYENACRRLLGNS